MFKHYLQISQSIKEYKIDEFQALLLSDNESTELAQLLQVSEKLKPVTEAAQDPIMSFSNAQTLFNCVTEVFLLFVPTCHHAHHL